MKKLLVGIDGQDESRDALRLARTIAAGDRAEIHVIAVIGYETIATGDEDYEVAHRAHFDQLFAMAWEELGEDYEAHRVTDVSPGAAITELAEELKASAIVIGSCHRGPLGRLALGEMGTKLTSGSPCPVIVAPRGYARRPFREGFKDIVVAYDGDAESDVALRSAAEYAREYGGTLRLVGVVPHLLSPARIGGTDRGYERMLRDEMASRLEAAAEIDDVETRTDLRIGNRPDEIVDASSDADLLVIGSRGYGPFGRVLLGGVSAKVMRSAACPVVVIPRGARRGVGRRELMATLAPFMV